MYLCELIVNCDVPICIVNQVVLEGVVGKGYKGDIAVDDIFVNTGACPPSGKTPHEKNERLWGKIIYNYI